MQDRGTLHAKFLHLKNLQIFCIVYSRSWQHHGHEASSSSWPCICGRHGQPSGWACQYDHRQQQHLSQWPRNQLAQWTRNDQANRKWQPARMPTNNSPVGRGDDLLGARGELDSWLLCLRVVGDDCGVVSRCTSQLASVTGLLLNAANDGSLGHGADGQDVSDVKLSCQKTERKRH